VTSLTKIQQYARDRIANCDVRFECFGCYPEVSPAQALLPELASIEASNAHKKTMETVSVGVGKIWPEQRACYVRGLCLEMSARGRSQRTRAKMLAAFRRHGKENRVEWYDRGSKEVRTAGWDGELMQPTIEAAYQRTDCGDGVIELPRLPFQGTSEEGEEAWQSLAALLGLSAFSRPMV